MKIAYDREEDALYIRFTDTSITTKHLEDGIALDYDAARRVHNPETLKQVVFEKVPVREIKNLVATNS